MATGNGAYVVHQTLAQHLNNYQIVGFNPYRTLFPPSLWGIGRGKAADVIHTTPDYAIFHARQQKPLVLTFHNYVLDTFMRPYSSRLQNWHYQSDLKWFTQLAVKRAQKITAVSQFTADLIKQEMGLEQDIKVIYNGIDTNRFQPKTKPAAKQVTVLFSGNPTQRKGAQWLLAIAKQLKPHIRLLYTSGLANKKTLPQADNLQNMGAVAYADMPALYQQADILLFPTVREGFSLSALEACACGLPVVASNISSLPELIDHGQGGFLCPLGDVACFAQSINQLADNALLRQHMGEYNRAKVEAKFQLSAMLQAYQDLFESI